MANLFPFREITFDADRIAEFRACFPCSGLPDTLTFITFEFDSRNWDCIDIVARHACGALLDYRAFDGAGLLALEGDAQTQLQRAEVA